MNYLSWKEIPRETDYSKKFYPTDWAKNLANGDVNFIDYDDIPTFTSSYQFVKWLYPYRAAITVHSSLDDKMAFLKPSDRVILQDRKHPNYTSYVGEYEGKSLDISFYPPGKSVISVRVQIGEGNNNIHYLLDFKEWSLPLEKIPDYLVTLPFGRYPSVSSVVRNLLKGLDLRPKGIARKVEGTAAQCYTGGLFRSHIRGLDYGYEEDRKSAYPSEVKNLQCCNEPYTHWREASGIRDLNKELMKENVCYAFLTIAESSPNEEMSTTRINCLTFQGTRKILLPKNGWYPTTYDLSMLRLKLLQGYRFGSTMHLMHGYIGYTKIEYRLFDEIIDKMRDIRLPDGSKLPEQVVKKLSVRLSGNFGYTTPYNEWVKPPTAMDLSFVGKWMRHRVLDRKATRISNWIYGGAVIGSQMANTLTRALQMSNDILRIGVDGIYTRRKSNLPAVADVAYGEWGLKYKGRVRVYSDPFVDQLDNPEPDKRKWESRLVCDNKYLKVPTRYKFDKIYDPVFDKSLLKYIEDCKTSSRLIPVGSNKMIWCGDNIDIMKERGTEFTPNKKDIPILLNNIEEGFIYEE